MTENGISFACLCVHTRAKRTWVEFEQIIRMYSSSDWKFAINSINYGSVR